MTHAATLLPDVEMAESARQALAGADLAVILTEWAEFKRLDLAQPEAVGAAARGHQEIDRHGLARLQARPVREHEQVEAGVGGAQPVLLLAPAGDRDEAQGRSVLGTQPARDLVAVHLRHADVEQRDLGPQAGRHLQRLGAVVRDPRVVAALAQALMHGLRQSGMANCGKHFPGHGWAEADSHVDVPRDERTLDELLAADAAPYGWLGISLASVMPAHVIYPAIDALPAGFSRRWIQEILRGRLGFEGAVFSDDLSMEGARVCGDVTQSAQAAIDAGCDFVLVCNDASAADQVLSRLRWTSSAAFEQRLQRLQPRGMAFDIDTLRGSAAYVAAHADLAALAAQLGT